MAISIGSVATLKARHSLGLGALGTVPVLVSVLITLVYAPTSQHHHGVLTLQCGVQTVISNAIVTISVTGLMVDVGMDVILVIRELHVRLRVMLGTMVRTVQIYATAEMKLRYAMQYLGTVHLAVRIGSLAKVVIIRYPD